DGFEIDRTPQWLMVPLFDRRRLVLLNGEGVVLSSTAPHIVDLVDPLTNRPGPDLLITDNRQVVQFEGHMTGDAVIVAEDVLTGAVIPLLEITVLPHRTVRVTPHFVTDPQHPAAGRTVQSVRDMSAVANRLYERQANVSIVATHDPNPLPFTTNLSDPAAPPRNGIQPITGATVGGETFPVLSARGDGAARVNIFYVWEWEP